ncbi:uncharacterized protein [Aegilops tauschii subsp. strangulata]|uniref:uncharacterized protein n=1 Tax=Aegilops tauschii subsp. strangulata TaxID=200361 RepID=UPI003CC8B5E2
MTSPSTPKDKFYKKVTNPYLPEVMQHPQTIEMHEGVVHIRDVQWPRRTGSMEARPKALEQEVFKCQGMVERGINAKHSMMMEFTHDRKLDNDSIGEAIFKLH